MKNKINQIARKKIGLFFSELIKEKKIPIEEIERKTGMSKTIIYKIINVNDNDKGYSIDSFLTLCGFLNIHLELSEMSIENSIIGMTDKLNNN